MGYRNFFAKNFVKPHSWFLAGVAFGFPKCCIKYFSGAIEANPFSTEFLFPETEGMWFSGTGYIACPECQKLPEAELRAVIDQHRFVKTPFPEQDPNSIELFKAYKHFKKHGVSEYYSEYHDLIVRLNKRIQSLRRGNAGRRAENEARIGAYPAYLGEFLRRNRRKLVKARLTPIGGWSFVGTRTCGTVTGLALLLGRNRGHYIWAVSAGSKVVDKVSGSLCRGFLTESGHYVPETLVSVPTIAHELYEAGWVGEKYDYEVINEELSRLRFRTTELNYDFQVKLSGLFDLHGGPATVRQTFDRIFDFQYLHMDLENDLLGPETAPFNVNFFHPKFGWGDLLKFREFSKDNEYLPMDLKIEYYFLMVQALKFEAYVNEVIKKRTKFLNGKESAFLDNIKTFVGQDMINRHVLAGNYVVVKSGDCHVYIHSDEFQRKVWKQFLEACREGNYLHPFGAVPRLRNRLVSNLGSFNQRFEIDVDGLVGNLGVDPIIDGLGEFMAPWVKCVTDELSKHQGAFGLYGQQQGIDPTGPLLADVVSGKMLDRTPLWFEDSFQAGNENYAFEADAHAFPIDELNMMYPVQMEVVTLQNTESVVPDHAKQPIGRLNRKGGGEVKVFHVDSKLANVTAGKAHEIDSAVFTKPIDKGFGDELMAQVRERNENLPAPTEADERGHLKIISEQGDKALVQKTNFELYQQAGAMGSEKPVAEPFYVELTTKYDENLFVSEQVKDVDVTEALAPKRDDANPPT